MGGTRADQWREIQRGLVATLPLVPGSVAVGLLYGVMARRVGLSPSEVLCMSVLVHAGSAQFIALGMWNTAGAATIILTTLVVNLRHLLMGASIATHLRHLSRPWKAVLALYMSDESYALAISAYEEGVGNHLYFLGANLGTGLSWWASGWLGAMLGDSMPDPSRYGLDLVFPLAFLGLLRSFLNDRRHVFVALVSGFVGLVMFQLLPGKWYVILAGLVGSSVGLLAEELGSQ